MWRESLYKFYLPVPPPNHSLFKFAQIHPTIGNRGLSPRILCKGELKSDIIILINKRSATDLDHPIAEDAEITIIPAIGGG
ncbi:MAG: MoaD/ThiS family protein [Candidatus Njordarchaeia archaeon]